MTTKTHITVSEKVLCDSPLHRPEQVLLLAQEILHSVYINTDPGHFIQLLFFQDNVCFWIDNVLMKVNI